MAYQKIFADPSDAAGEPPVTDAAASSIRESTWPYSRRADVNVSPRILLRPPAAAGPSDDPLISSIQSLQDVMQQVQRATRLISAPWLIEPPDSESFHNAAGINLPAVSATNFTTVLSITCPVGRNGVIKRIANVIVGGAWADFSGTAIWQICRNPGAGVNTGGFAERNYQNIQASLGLVNAPTQISGIRIFENDVISWVVRNVSLPTSGVEAGALLGGYFYPKTWDDQFERQDHSNAW
jgi:hypothetical protein